MGPPVRQARAIRPRSVGLVIDTRRRAAAVGLWSTASGLALAVGPPGGAIVDGLGWRWVFLVNAPLALVLVLAAARVLPGLAHAPAQNGFVAATLSALVVFFAFVGAIVYFSAYFQQVQGHSPVIAGSTWPPSVSPTRSRPPPRAALSGASASAPP
jgi:predicted MFS family arabinose efflux permease